jgi:hypothetical protein
MPVGYLTSSTLIETVKREAMIPTSQSTFTATDFLAMANQEMRIGLVPSIMQYHQEYYVRDSMPIKIVPNQSAYPIPYRAIGGKFRECFYLDSNNNLMSMSRISPDDRPFYQDSSYQNRFIYFYLQGNDIVLVPDVGANPTGSLIFSFYMRPNELVDESRVGTIKSISTTNQSGVITNISATGPSVLTSAGHNLVSGNVIKITGSNSSPSVDGFYPITVVDTNTFSIPITVMGSGTQGTWTYATATYGLDQMPVGFSPSVKMDLMQTNPGHKTIAFDVYPLTVDPVNKTITFNISDVTSFAKPPSVGVAPVVGDYISFAGECIIPQAPADLHDVLSQRVVLRCLQALGDQNGATMAASKLGEMEKYTANLVDNRAEGQPQKVNNVRGILRSSKMRAYRQ